MPASQNFPIPENLYDASGRRLVLVERFLQLPALNAAIAISNNLNFELLGLNALTADQEYNAEGGFNLVTGGAATDSAIVLPHLDTEQTAWASTTWGSDQQTHWGCHIRIPTALTEKTVWCGLKLTNTPVITTDADSCFFRYSQGTNTTWQCLISNTNVDTAIDSGVTVAADTEYRIWITIDAARVPHFFINGNLVGEASTTALKDATDLIPYIGVLSATNATVKKLTVRNQWISRLNA